jgi:hypothetical protein
MKPGPMAEVAMRNIAPISVDLVLDDIFELEDASPGSARWSGLLAGVCDMELLTRSYFRPYGREEVSGKDWSDCACDSRLDT